MTPADIEEILTLIEASHFEEVEITIDSFHIRVRKKPPAGAVRTPPAAAARISAPVPDPAPAGPGPRVTSAKRVEVTAPSIGTFYRAPAPGAAPFVEVGSTVEEGQSLGLVEVMKLFNTIESPLAGRVAVIHVDNAATVEYGQLLFTLEVNCP